MPYGRRSCEICGNKFQPRDAAQRRCLQCRNAPDVESEDLYVDYRPGKGLPQASSHLAAPMIQGVFDLETMSLDRSFGVLMVGSIMVFGDGKPKSYTFDLTQTSGWPDKRSDDSELAAMILQVLEGCHILYAHNGLNFDIPWLNTVALRYNLPPLERKLVDPVQVARKKYRLGSNSLSNIAAFLGAPEQKMPLAAEVWRRALLDNDQDSWNLLKQRCESDVRVLAYIAGRIARDVGLIDKAGSAWR